jgi:hypothetical protein
MNWRAFLDAWKYRERLRDHEARLQEVEKLIPRVKDHHVTMLEQVRSVVRSVVNQYRQDIR